MLEQIEMPLKFDGYFYSKTAESGGNRTWSCDFVTIFVIGDWRHIVWCFICRIADIKVILYMGIWRRLCEEFVMNPDHWGYPYDIIMLYNCLWYIFNGSGKELLFYQGFVLHWSLTKSYILGSSILVLCWPPFESFMIVVCKYYDYYCLDCERSEIVVGKYFFQGWDCCFISMDFIEIIRLYIGYYGT